MLKVSANGRSLVREDGRPFFWLADTAWMLLYRLDREETERYLKTRAEQGFTVIMVMGICEFEELRMPNAYGELQFLDKDPLKPNERFYAHVDWVLRRAADFGLTVAFLPTWGDKVGPLLAWGKGPILFDEDKARRYGQWLGTRYRGHQDLVWAPGGDRPALHTPEGGALEDYRPVWRAMVQGLKAGDQGSHLMTYHPLGGNSSSQWLQGEPWMDFHMIQSGHHARDQANYAMIARDWNLSPAKPVHDAEANYEDHPVNWDPRNGWFDDLDVRKTCYWSLFAGAFGYTYGACPTWAFIKPGANFAGHERFGARRAWQEGQHLPGAGQLCHARALMESRPQSNRVPDQDLIAGDAGEGPFHMQALRDEEGSFALVYAASGQPMTIRLDRLKAKRLKAHWFDPRSGQALLAGELEAIGEQTFVPPLTGPGVDWVLALDDTARAYPLPGGT